VVQAPKSEIVPRWEWRAFGDRFVDAERRLAALTPARVHESRDLHLVSQDGGSTVKVRDGMMDVKHLVRLDQGLELWCPVMQTPFPLAADDVRRVLTDLHVSIRTRARGDYALEDVLEELVTPNADVVAVAVHKRRAHYTLGDCLVELTDVRTDRGDTRTIAVESEQPTQVLAAVRRLGLAGLPNVSYPHWLQMLVGFMPARFAVIDVGTNSVKLCIGERAAGRPWRTVVDRAEVTRLGEGLERTGALQPAPMQRTAAALTAMVDEALHKGALAIAAVGTAGLRIASNSTEFIDAVDARSGVRIEVIPAEEEGRLAYLAAKRSLGLGAGALVVFDSGGGSSQFTFGHGTRIDDRFSLNVGAARVTERFGLDGPVAEEVLADAFAAVAADLAPLDGRPAPDELIGMGGAMTSLAAVRHGLATYDPERVQGTALDCVEIDRQIELYRTLSVGARRRIVGLQPKRAEVILAGAVIVRTVMSKLCAESVTVCDRGLRHGVLMERFALPHPDRPSA